MLIQLFYSLKSPNNLSYVWNLGSLLGMILIIQVISGFILTFYYENSHNSFDILWTLHLDTSNGALIHLIHLNMSSYIFMFLYFHMIKALFYISFSQLSYVWNSGWVIMIMMMMVAFMGYVLPWGQMSLWGATVITNLVSALPLIGPKLVLWIWGGYFVSNFTMKLFFSIHFILPFIIMCMIMIHLFFLHISGSSNPMGGFNMLMKEEFNSLYIWKDFLNIVILLVITSMIMFKPYFYADPENFIKASSLMSPIHIQPEWYFLQYYAILRAIPNKLGGILFFLLSLLLLLFLSLIKFLFQSQTMKLLILINNLFIMTNLLLMWLGGCSVEYPYVELSMILMIIYFIYPLMLFLFSV